MKATEIASTKLTIVPFTPELALDFKNINEQWIREMFSLEAKDQKVLNDPQTTIIQNPDIFQFFSLAHRTL